MLGKKIDRNLYKLSLRTNCLLMLFGQRLRPVPSAPYLSGGLQFREPLSASEPSYVKKRPQRAGQTDKHGNYPPSPTTGHSCLWARCPASNHQKNTRAWQVKGIADSHHLPRTMFWVLAPQDFKLARPPPFSAFQLILSRMLMVDV